MSEVFDVRWTRTAVRDLDEILEYIAAERGLDQALQLYGTLRHSFASLAKMPRRCRQVPKLLDIGLFEYREVIERPYRLVFRIVDQEVVILAILDSRRALEELLIQRTIEGQIR
jgi:plasmid stabilization system protein ParE